LSALLGHPIVLCLGDKTCRFLAVECRQKAGGIAMPLPPISASRYSKTTNPPWPDYKVDPDRFLKLVLTDS
jgi:hypothetical protein